MGVVHPSPIPSFVLRVLLLLAAALSSRLKSRAALQPENPDLRHQIGVLQRSAKKRPELTAADRFLWARLSGVRADWRSALLIVKPEPVMAWHRKGFRLFWTWEVRRGQPGRPPVCKETQELIRMMSRENPLWGAPRIHGELLKPGIDAGEASVGKYMMRRRKPRCASLARTLALPRLWQGDRVKQRLQPPPARGDPVSGPGFDRRTYAGGLGFREIEGLR